MSLNISTLNTELEHIFNYWNKHVINNEQIAAEVNINGNVNPDAELGSMYLGRIIYGASIACKTLDTNKYLPIAKQAFDILEKRFKNPKGGYYWAFNSKNLPIHDIENNNLAQAFVLYGLVEYALHTNNDDVCKALDIHIQFILETLTDKNNGGFLDGFDENWIPISEQNKALGTHLHLLEAFEKVYLFNNSVSIKALIEELILIITDKFIDSNSLHCLHRLSTNWQPLPNEIWAGHDVEVSWILCMAAKTIENNALIKRCNELAIITVDNILTLATDKQHGGMFNVLENGVPAEKFKAWWPQAEMVIALLNCYEVSSNKKYLELAVNFSSYISNNFISDKGEWFTELKPDNSVLESTPIVFFWKALYHNVRYYAELSERLKKLNITF